MLADLLIWRLFLFFLFPRTLSFVLFLLLLSLYCYSFLKFYLSSFCSTLLLLLWIHIDEIEANRNKLNSPLLVVALLWLFARFFFLRIVVVAFTSIVYTALPCLQSRPGASHCHSSSFFFSSSSPHREQ